MGIGRLFTSQLAAPLRAWPHLGSGEGLLAAAYAERAAESPPGPPGPGAPEQSPARALSSSLSAAAPAQPLLCRILGICIPLDRSRILPYTPEHAAPSFLLPLAVKCCLCHLGILTRTTQLIQQLLISAGTGAGTEGGTGHLHGLGSFKTWDEVKVGRGWLKALSRVMFNSLRTIS